MAANDFYKQKLWNLFADYCTRCKATIKILWCTPTDLPHARISEITRLAVLETTNLLFVLVNSLILRTDAITSPTATGLAMRIIR